MTHRHPLRRLLADDRGSVSLWMLGITVVVILLAGLVVDVGGQVQAQQRAHAVAAQAARVAGQQLQGPALVRGDAAAVDVARGVAAAQDYLAGSDVAGSVAITGGNVITVTTSTTHPTQFLGVIGISQLDATGHAEAQTTRALAGAAQ